VKKKVGASVKSIPEKNKMLWYFLGIFFISGLMLAWVLWPFTSTIILAGVITSTFQPMYRRLAQYLSPYPASLLSCLLIFFILFVPVAVSVGALSREAYGLYQMGKDAVMRDQIRTFIENSHLIEIANQWLARFHFQLTGEELNRMISEIGKVIGLFLYEQASEVASNILAFLFYFFFMLLIIFYFFIDGARLKRFFMDLSPLPEKEDILLFRKFHDMAGAILIGNGLSGLIQGILGGAAFAAFGLKSPVLWGVIMAFMAFVPIFGTGVILIPTVVYLYGIDRIQASFFFLLFYIVTFGTVEYFVKPRLVGQRVNMHTLLVFLSIMGGLKLFGVLGIIYGPLVVAMFLALSEIYLDGYKNLIE
jgi:predicted PurR-regulated permease PerM